MADKISGFHGHRHVNQLFSISGTLSISHSPSISKLLSPRHPKTLRTRRPLVSGDPMTPDRRPNPEESRDIYCGPTELVHV